MRKSDQVKSSFFEILSGWKEGRGMEREKMGEREPETEKKNNHLKMTLVFEASAFLPLNPPVITPNLL